MTPMLKELERGLRGSRRHNAARVGLPQATANRWLGNDARGLPKTLPTLGVIRKFARLFYTSDSGMLLLFGEMLGIDVGEVALADLLPQGVDRLPPMAKEEILGFIQTVVDRYARESGEGC